ncbi:MAG: NAD(P)H-quinone oxidoreductase [Sphingomonadaceae bacterium]
MLLPPSMKHIVCRERGGPDVLRVEESALPTPGYGEVLIKVAAAGVNRPDAMQRSGKYPPPPGAPDTLGLEVAGEIVQLGENVEPTLSGMPVCALVSGGGYAEYAVAPARQCLPIPSALTLIEAAALPETLFTVWTNVFERAYAGSDDILLVHGGTSGIGTMATQLGKLFNLTVIVTCGSDEKCAAARAIGADHAINYRTTDFVEQVRAITDGKGADVVLDMVGGDYVPRNIACMAEDGRHVSIAIQRGAKAEIPIWMIMQKRLTLTGSTLRPRSASFKGLVAEELQHAVWPFVVEGALKPVIDQVFPLHEAAAAHARMESGDHIGKIVLEVGN